MTTALITGPTSGLGRQFAIQLAAAGHDLILVSRDETRLTELSIELSEGYGTQSEIIPTDLADRQQLSAVEQRLADRSQPVDWLINNAGFGLSQSFLEATVDDEQRMIDVMVTAPMRLTHAALPGMLERGFGRNIVVSSVASWLTTGTYSAAKAWATVFVEGLQNEVGDSGVNVTALCPGFVRTEFHERAAIQVGSVPEKMWLKADEVVQTAIKDCDKGRVLSVPSQQYQVLAQVARVSPRSVVRRLSSMR